MFSFCSIFDESLQGFILVCAVVFPTRYETQQKWSIDVLTFPLAVMGDNRFVECSQTRLERCDGIHAS